MVARSAYTARWESVRHSGSNCPSIRPGRPESTREVECKLLRPWGIDHAEYAEMTQNDRYYMIFVVVAVLVLDLAATFVFLKAIA
ncbi:hypothetical protein PPUN12996_46850 [Pseudomonas putida]|nr:hypothetical protein PPUN12996_46850 [Pseudomonas putida]